MAQYEVPLVTYKGDERQVVGTAMVDDTNVGPHVIVEMTIRWEYVEPITYGIPCHFSIEKKED